VIIAFIALIGLLILLNARADAKLRAQRSLQIDAAFGRVKVIGVTLDWDMNICLAYEGGYVMFGGRQTDILLHPEYFPDGVDGPIVHPDTGEVSKWTQDIA